MDDTNLSNGSDRIVNAIPDINPDKNQVEELGAGTPLQTPTTFEEKRTEVDSTSSASSLSGFSKGNRMLSVEEVENVQQPVLW